MAGIAATLTYSIDGVWKLREFRRKLRAERLAAANGDDDAAKVNEPYVDEVQHSPTTETEPITANDEPLTPTSDWNQSQTEINHGKQQQENLAQILYTKIISLKITWYIYHHLISTLFFLNHDIFLYKNKEKKLIYGLDVSMSRFVWQEHIILFFKINQWIIRLTKYWYWTVDNTEYSVYRWKCHE